MHLQFVESESTFAYLRTTRAYFEAWGKPVAFYSDKHGVFRVNQTGTIGGDRMTQLGRALLALNIIICANSSLAKVRVERRTRSCRTGWSRSRSWPVRAFWLMGTPSSRRSWLITTALCQATGEYKGSARAVVRRG